MQFYEAKQHCYRANKIVQLFPCLMRILLTVDHNVPFQIFVPALKFRPGKFSKNLHRRFMYLYIHGHVTVSDGAAGYSLVTVTIPSVLPVTHPMNSFWYILLILTSLGMKRASSLWQWSTGRSGSSSNLTGVRCGKRGVFGSIQTTGGQTIESCYRMIKKWVWTLYVDSRSIRIILCITYILTTINMLRSSIYNK